MAELVYAFGSHTVLLQFTQRLVHGRARDGAMPFLGLGEQVP
jgi:hypothetical protein